MLSPQIRFQGLRIHLLSHNESQMLPKWLKYLMRGSGTLKINMNLKPYSPVLLWPPSRQRNLLISAQYNESLFKYFNSFCRVCNNRFSCKFSQAINLINLIPWIISFIFRSLSSLSSWEKITIKIWIHLVIQIRTETLLEFVDIFFPIRNCKGLMVKMQIKAPITALIPNFKCNKYIITPI